jgi:hypothetical protein
MSWRLLLLLLPLLHDLLLCSSRWEGCGSIIKEMEYMGLHKILPSTVRWRMGSCW